MDKFQQAWRVRITVRLKNGNDSIIDCLNKPEAEAEILRLRMAENPAIESWSLCPVSFSQWRAEKNLIY